MIHIKLQDLMLLNNFTLLKIVTITNKALTASDANKRLSAMSKLGSQPQIPTFHTLMVTWDISDK